MIQQKLKIVNINDIETLEDNFNYNKIEQLKKDISINGQLKPINLHGKYFKNQKYQVWNGHHRLIALKELGFKKVIAIIDLNTILMFYNRKEVLK